MPGAPASRPTRPRRGPADSNRFPIGAFVVLVLLTASWSWWSLKQGAYFPAVFNPGIVVLCAGLGLLLWAAPWRGRLALSRATRIAALAMFGLAAWTLSSVLWSPSPDISVSDAQRVLAYLVAFALGAWLCNMLGRYMHLALLPVVLAAGITGAVTVVALLQSTDLVQMLSAHATLQYPLGYRNANAAFFLIALWPALALSANRGLDRRLRVLCLIVAAASIDLAALSQSRGSFIGAAAGLVVFLIAARERPRALAWIIVVALPLAIVVPAASDLYVTAADGLNPASLQAMRSAGHAILLALVAAAALAMILLSVEARIPARLLRDRRSALVASALAIVFGLLAFTVVVGDPVSWVGERFDQFESGEPDLQQSTNRFTLNAGSNRSDVWRVAIDAAEDDPLFGDGSGGFQYRYLKDRHAQLQVARDAHSVELETLSELGIPGFALLVLAFGGATAAMIRARRLGPNAIVLSSGALGALGYWVAHSSFDWFWSYPAVTAPVFGLLGAACAPTMLHLGSATPQRSTRIAIGACALLLAASVIPAFLSGRFLDNAYSEFRTDKAVAYDDLAKARSLDPLSDEPILAEGAIAKASGDQQRAIDAFDEAVRKRPEEWAGHFFLAQLYAADEPKLALSELAAAQRLNPLSDQIAPLRARIKR